MLPSLLKLVKYTTSGTDRTLHHTRREQIALSTCKEQVSIPFAPCECSYWLRVRINALRIIILTDVFFQRPSLYVERFEAFELINKCVWNVSLSIR